MARAGARNPRQIKLVKKGAIPRSPATICYAATNSTALQSFVARIAFQGFSFRRKECMVNDRQERAHEQSVENGLTNAGTEYYETYRESHYQTESTLNNQALPESQVTPKMK